MILATEQDNIERYFFFSYSSNGAYKDGVYKNTCAK